MKILTSKRVPSWTKVLVYLIIFFVSIIMIVESLVLAVCFFFITSAISFLYFRFLEKIDKWKITTLKSDPFFKEGSFTLAGNGLYSFIAVSQTVLRIVNINPTIYINRRTYKIYEIYKKYPKNGLEIDLNGYHLYYLDIPISELKEVSFINQGDAGWPFLAKGMKFGIRIQTLSGDIYDVDTPFQKEFCDEINKFLNRS
jgi:hypothetical protein